MKNKLSEDKEISVLLNSTFDLIAHEFHIYRSAEVNNESEHFTVTIRLERKKGVK